MAEDRVSTTDILRVLANNADLTSNPGDQSIRDRWVEQNLTDSEKDARDPGEARAYEQGKDTSLTDAQVDTDGEKTLPVSHGKDVSTGKDVSSIGKDSSVSRKDK